MQFTLMEAQEKYRIAQSEHSAYVTKCKEWQQQYDAGVTGTPAEPKMVYNFTQELINSQISGTIPMPLVTPRERNDVNDERARTITAMLRKEIERINAKRLIDQSERTTRVMGASVYMLEWDWTKKNRTQSGEIAAQMYSPIDFVPQAGITNFDDMDYWFIVREDTKERIADRYGVEVSELDGIESDRDNENTNEVVTQIVMMYRSGKDTFGYISWVGDTVLVDMEDYLGRKDKVCTSCGAHLAANEDCECGAKGTEWADKDGEDLEMELTLQSGQVVSPMQIEEEKPGVFAVKPRKIPYYKMNMPPLAYRINVTKEDSLFGSSDCGAIKRLQTGANIATDKISEKMAFAMNLTTMPSDLEIETNNRIGAVLKLTNPAQIEQVRAISLEYDASRDFAVVDSAYSYAKNILGITDVFQGKADANAKAAQSKELMIQQAQGVQDAKNRMKEAAFSQLYEVMFKMMLAFSDERRGYEVEDEDIAEFIRYDFLEYDQATDELYYYDEFVFEVDNTSSTEHDKPYMMQQIQADYQMGAYGQPGTPEALYLLWKERESVGFPRAKENAAYWKEQKEQAALQQAQQMQQAQMMQGIQGGMQNGLPQMQSGNVY